MQSRSTDDLVQELDCLQKRIGDLEGIISEQGCANEELHERIEWLELALDCVNDGVWEWDFRSRMFRRTSQWYRMTGYTPEELIQWESENGSIIHPDDISLVRTASRQHETNEKDAYRAEFRIKHKSGEWRWILGRGRIVERDDHGTPVRMLGTDTDITESKLVQQALSDSERNSHSVLEAMSDGIHVVDENLQIVFFNGAFRKWCDELGIGIGTESDCADKNLFDVFPFLDESIRQEYDEVLRTGAVLVTEERTAIGSREFLTETVKIPVIESGKACRIVTLVRDITERKRAEASLRRSEEMYRLLADSVSDVFYALDRDLKVTYWNRCIEKILGKKADEVIGRHAYEVFPYLKGSEPNELYSTVLATGESGTLEVEYDYRGTRRLFDMTVYPSKEGLAVFAQDVTERREAEEALRKSEENYRLLVENANSIILRMDRDGNVTFFNGFAQSFFGYSEEEILGRNVVGTIVPEKDMERNDMREMILDIGRNPEKYANNENENILRNGERVWVAWTNRPLYDSNGEIAETLCIGNDTTGRKLAEGKLRESLRRFEAIVENTPLVAIQGFDREGVIQHWNSACECVYGFNADEAIGRKIQDLLLEEADVPGFNQTLKDIWASGHSAMPREWSVHTRTGEKRWVYSSMFPVSGENTIAEVFRMDIDVTDRKNAEEELRRSEANYRTIFNEANDAIFVHDITTGAILDVNQKADELFGYAVEDSGGIEVGDFSAGVPPYTQEDALRWIRKAASGEPQVFEWLGKHKDGRLLWLEVNLKRAEIAGEKRLLAVVRDITDRKRADQERQRLEEQIRQAQKMESLGILAGGIAHDFNNILMGILGNADIASCELSDVSPVRPYIEDIKQASQRAADLCRQMLAYSGKGAFVIESLVLNELIEEMIHLLESSVSKKANLRYNFADDLPEISADASQIQQIVINLVINASEALGDKSGTIDVSTGWKHCLSSDLQTPYVSEELPEGEYAYLEISDTGVGMDEATRTRIFDPFFTTKFTGRGLGLSAILGIVRGHKGSIKVLSEPGRGTIFTVFFPSVGRSSSRDTSREAPRGEVRASGTVLVVDDEEIVLAVAGKMLQRLGCDVEKATTGREAVHLLRERGDEIACVLLDLSMPDMGGEETFEEIRRMNPAVPVFVSSGYSEQEASKRFAGRDIAGFIQKPYQLSVLKQGLSAVFG